MAKTIQECAFAAYTNHPQGMEAGLELCTTTIRRTSLSPSAATSAWWTSTAARATSKVRRSSAVDDCGNIINPMIVDGQIHGG